MLLRALIYLRLMSLKNWTLWRVRRLRRPKYLIGTVVGFAYFYFFFIRHALPGRQHVRVAPAVPTVLPDDWLPVIFAIGSMVLLVILSSGWLLSTGRAALGFSEAEIAFLFPAPVRRRTLVHFHLLTGQLRTLVAGLVMALLSNRWATGGNALTHVLGWWLVFSTMNLHSTGARFALSRVANRGGSVASRRIAAVLLVLAVVAVSVWRLPDAWRVPSAFGEANLRAAGEWLVGVTSTAPLTWLLYPLRLVLRPFFAADTWTFLIALGPAAGVIVAHYLWVVHTAVSFEDATISQAEKRAATAAAQRSGKVGVGPMPVGGRRAPFRLSDGGPPEVAFLWKNLLSTWPYFTLRVLGVAAAVIVAATIWIHTNPSLAAFGNAAAVIAAVIGAYVLILGPHFARQDIRGDLRNLDILKTYPLSGWQIVLGELLTPTAILSGCVWLAVLTLVLNVNSQGVSEWLTPAMRAAFGIGLATLVPPLVMLQLLVPNAAAVVFPSWTEVNRAHGGGPEVLGQRMIFFFAQMLTIAVALLPAAVVGGVLTWVLQLAISLPAAALIASVPCVALLVGEVAAGLWWLGRRFEKLDVAEELRE